MRVLVTSSRLPFALDMIRKLAERGHEVFASDAYDLAPGSHSKFLAGHFVTGSPKEETEKFLDDVERIVTENEIEVLVPAFEEVFYLATRHERLSKLTRLFGSPFDVLAKVHDKSTFEQLCERLGVPTPETITARTDDELREAIGRWPRYFARAAFSRGGVALLTNTGPLAGHVRIEDCHPTAASPWLVQEFVDGPMVCTYSTVHDGRINQHCTYHAPRQWEHSTGIQFESVDGSETLEVAQKIAADIGYTGQLSLDFVQMDDGLAMIECNPRATDGVLLTPAEDLEGGILDPDRELRTVEPGRKVQLDLAVFGETFKEPIRNIPKNFRELVDIRGSDRGWHDLTPTLYSFLAFAHHARLSRREHEQLFVAMAEGITWDGEHIDGMSKEDEAVLAELDSSRG